jgi:signal transduction histidine kinase
LYLSIAGLVLLGFIAFLLLYINQTRKTQLARKTSELQTEQIKRLETEKQNIILDSMLKGEEQERSRVAKDLHDGVGSLLSGVKLSLSSMQGNLIVDSDQASVFERSLRQLDDAIREMRRVAHNMMPEALIQKGLLSAISGLCAGIVESGGPKVHFEQYGLEDRLPSSYEVILYRLVQEMINNALKYSSARQIIIQLSRQGNTLTLVCEDDGRGFDPALWENSSGIGFYTMKSRIEYLNGKVHLQTTPETGTSFLIEFQLSHD